MYNLKKRAYFTTLGELRMLLKDYPDETPVYNCGCEDSWLHIDAEGKFISLDNESLFSDYSEELEAQGISGELEEYYEIQQRKEHQQRLDEAFYEQLPRYEERTLDYLEF